MPKNPDVKKVLVIGSGPVSYTHLDVYKRQAFQNAKIKEAVEKLLTERDGLCLGICNGCSIVPKLKPSTTFCIKTEISSLHRLPILPSCVP